MNRIIQLVAWLCIFSTLFMGCYSSVTIDPNGKEREKIYSGKIQQVVTKDGAKYWFEEPPAIVRDTIIGDVNIDKWDGYKLAQVSLPLSDVAEVSVGEFSVGVTIMVIVMGAGILVAVGYAVAHALDRPWGMGL